ncbi:hypothetical protein LPJ73_002748, partial [Coemansia sp. RSA 2703]
MSDPNDILRSLSDQLAALRQSNEQLGQRMDALAARASNHESIDRDGTGSGGGDESIKDICSCIYTETAVLETSDWADANPVTYSGLVSKYPAFAGSRYIPQDIKGSLQADAQAANVDYKDSLHTANNYRVLANIFVLLNLGMEALTEATDEVEEGLLSDFTQQCLRDGLAFALKEGENERQKFLDKLPKVPSFKPIRDTLKATRKDHEDILAGKEDEYKQALQTAHLIAVAKASG